MEIFTPSSETIVRSSPFSTIKWGNGMVYKTQTKYINLFFFRSEEPGKVRRAKIAYTALVLFLLLAWSAVLIGMNRTVHTTVRTRLLQYVYSRV